MAEVLSELVAKITTDATELKRGLADAEHKTEASSKKMSDSLKKIGIAMAASGAAITAAMGLMGKAAIDEEINIKRLQVALKGVGTNYDDVKDSLEAVITATQRKTGIADNQQRDVLSQLILVTKNYDKALGLLPLALDLATFSQMDTRSAATYLGKAFEELEAGAEKIGIRMGTTTIYFKDLDEVQKMVGGTAEAMANPFSQLSAAMSDVSEVIGGFLVPHIKELIGKVIDVAIKIQNWSSEHPELAKTLTLVTAGLGLVIGAIGTLILALPQLISSYKALIVVINAARNANIAFNLTLYGVPGLLAGLVALGIYLGLASDKWVEYKKSISDTTTEQKELTSEQERGVKALDELIRKSGGKGIIKTAEDTKLAIEKIKARIADLKAEYGDLGNAIKSKGDMARQAAQVAKDALSSELDKARESTDKQLGFLSKLYAEKIRLVNAGAEVAIKGIQDQIDAIDALTEQENRELEDKQDKDRLAKLSGQDRTDFLAEIERKRVLREREDRKEALRDSIEKVRTETRNKVDKLNEELVVAQQVERDRLTATENRIKQTNISLDIALDKELKRLAVELKEAEKQEMEKLGILDNALLKEEEATQASYDKRLEQAKEYQRQLSSIMGGGELPAGVTGMPIPAGGLKTSPWGVIVGPGERATGPGGEVFIGQHGGIVTQPTMSLIGEAGPEAVIPLNEAGVMGGITINFTQPVFFDREDTMNRFVDMIRKGIQRQDRLRFGGAYNG